MKIRRRTVFSLTILILKPQAPHSSKLKHQIALCLSKYCLWLSQADMTSWFTTVTPSHFKLMQTAGLHVVVFTPWGFAAALYV